MATFFTKPNKPTTLFLKVYGLWVASIYPWQLSLPWQRIGSAPITSFTKPNKPITSFTKETKP